MSLRTARRGQPIIALMVVLGAWVGARVLMWEPAPEMTMAHSAASAPAVAVTPARPAEPDMAASPAPSPLPPAWRPRPLPFYRVKPVPAMPRPLPTSSSGESVRIAVGHQLLWMAAVSLVRMPDPPPLPYISRDPLPSERRWSADGWMMLRDGGVSSPATGPARATYGASQLGAVVRYRLVPDSTHRPAAYLRGAAALARPFDKEAAAGISARPIGGMPITLAAEVRAGELSSRFRVRPAVVAVTELPPQRLPFELRGEAYAQAGYVGGKGGTPFVDGQARVDRALGRVGSGELRAGGGAWGGAQEGASRLDIGPAATLGIPVSDGASARLALDWRFRVSGNAVPQSGPAVTLSAGF